MAAVLVPLGWIAGSALLQRDILWSTSLYGRCALGAAVVALTLAAIGLRPSQAPRPMLER